MTKLDELRELADEISSVTQGRPARLDFASEVHSHIYALLDVAQAAALVRHDPWCAWSSGPSPVCDCAIKDLHEALEKLK
jgi:hypothetical protein